MKVSVRPVYIPKVSKTNQIKLRTNTEVVVCTFKRFMLFEDSAVKKHKQNNRAVTWQVTKYIDSRRRLATLADN